MITFFKSRNIESRAKVEPATGQYIGKYRTGLDTLAQVYYEDTGFFVGPDFSSTSSVLNGTNISSNVKVGDLLVVDSGVSALIGESAFVQSTTADSITLSQTMSTSLALAQLKIFRPRAPMVNSVGATNTAITHVGNTLQLGGFQFKDLLAFDSTITNRNVVPIGVYNIGLGDFLAWDGTVTAIPSGTQAVSGTVSTLTDLISIGGNPTDFFTDGLSVDHGFISGGGYNEDNQLAGALHLKQSAPGVSSVGLITRNIPSGTQTVDGTVNPTRPASGTPVRNAAITTATDILAANANRRALWLHCESGQIYWRFGGTASATSYTGILNGGQWMQWSESCPTQALNVFATSSSIASATEFTG
jgi:hypothetical protein